MKTLMQNIFILSVLVLINACSMNDNAIPPQQKILTGTGIMYGTAHIEPMQGGDSRDYNHSGILVEVVGTNLSAYTTYESKAKNGNFILRGLDSGTYTLRFSKAGYETQTISNIYHNGSDSSIMKWVVSDSNGQTVYNGVALSESAPKLTIDSYTASAKQIINIDTLNDHGNQKINRDTIYSAVIDFRFKANTPFDWSKENHPIAYIAYIDKSDKPSSSNKPNTEYKNGDLYLNEYVKSRNLPGGIVKTGIKPSSSQNVDYTSLKSIAQLIGTDLSKKEQLYLHVYPIAMQSYTTLITSKYDPPLLGGNSKWVVQDPISIPIQWK